jgi:hypothetical protein
MRQTREHILVHIAARVIRPASSRCNGERFAKGGDNVGVNATRDCSKSCVNGT